MQKRKAFLYLFACHFAWKFQLQRGHRISLLQFSDARTPVSSQPPHCFPYFSHTSYSSRFLFFPTFVIFLRPYKIMFHVAINVRFSPRTLVISHPSLVLGKKCIYEIKAGHIHCSYAALHAVILALISSSALSAFVWRSLLSRMRFIKPPAIFNISQLDLNQTQPDVSDINFKSYLSILIDLICNRYSMQMCFQL